MSDESQWNAPPAKQAAESVVYFVNPSEARNLFDLSGLKEGEIPRFARNDKKRGAVLLHPVKPNLRC